MHCFNRPATRALMRGASLGVLGAACAFGAPALAETAEPSELGEVVVTATRIQRAGYDAPTPTTVVSEDELRVGARPNIGAVINDLPASRPTVSGSTNMGSVSSGTIQPDLRSLGSVRTLVLIEGRRFVGAADLNNVPMNLVKQVDVVTGGASAAWGSGAVGGVVNIVLDDEFTGGRANATYGESTRGDGRRYAIDGAFGRSFLDGRGHLMVSAEYVKDRGIFGRNDGSRPNLDSSLFTTATGQLLLANDVNSLQATNGGLITSGILAGQSFNPDGSLSSLIRGATSNATQTIGGNGRGGNDASAVSAPYERGNIFARASYDFGGATAWVLGDWSRVTAPRYVLFADSTLGTATSGLLVQADNPFLSPSVRAALVAAGQTSFRMGKFFEDPGLPYTYERETRELSAGVNGEVGGWTYRAYIDHGEIRNDMQTGPQRITANFANAIDAVRAPSGQIVCRVALTNPASTCAPLNIFGEGNMSEAGIAYAFGKGQTIQTTKLDAAGLSLSGTPFSTWAGPVGVAGGVEWRRESLKTNYVDPLTRAGAMIFTVAALNGDFNVGEAFGEVAVPVLKIDDVAAFDLNAAARYSDYSTSGGIWSWKLGGTLRLYNDLLLRGTVSRDIRSPSISELYSSQRLGVATVIDPTRNNASTVVNRYTGGNPDLDPETAKTYAVGGSYAPSFAPGLRLSVDYYRIKIDGVIATISAQDSIAQCQAGNQPACDTIVRDASGVITTLYGNWQNLAYYKTSGVDFDVAYAVPGDVLGGSLRLRLLATHVFDIIINDGVRTVDRAGDVGDGATFSSPKDRATVSAAYQRDAFGLDVRARYVSGGKFNSQQQILNNDISSRTYVDLGVRYDLGPATLHAEVNNLFDRDPPFAVGSSTNYDVVGRYFSGGVRLKF